MSSNDRELKPVPPATAEPPFNLQEWGKRAAELAARNLREQTMLKPGGESIQGEQPRPTAPL